ncbi:hypothetical protein RRG08_014977 [Elysia crispata]|uniref:Uncharacterized protein n=1 Tax=Elysia crispata TaxID=231223 RepID=A0AAE1DMX2_9GAST|nr:hypothetical protein RRG08_014977 [Elysia crispata]
MKHHASLMMKVNTTDQIVERSPTTQRIEWLWGSGLGQLWSGGLTGHKLAIIPSLSNVPWFRFDPCRSWPGDARDMSSSRSSSSEDSYSDGISGGAATACWEGSASLTDRPSSQHSGQGHRVEVIANPIEAEGQGEVPVYKRIHRDASDPGRKVRFAEEGYSHRASRKMRPNHKKRSRSGKSGRAKRRRSNKLVISGDGGRESEVTSSDEDNASLTARCISLALGPSQNTVALVGFRSLVGYLLSVLPLAGMVCVLAARIQGTRAAISRPQPPLRIIAMHCRTLLSL